MKILVALSYSPYPIRRGTGRLVDNLITGLAERHRVILATMYIDEEQREHLLASRHPNITIRSIPAPNTKSSAHRLYYKARNLARAVAVRIPTVVSYAAPPAFIDLIRRSARDEGAELVMAFYWHLFDLPDMLAGFRLALATQDIDYLIHPQRMRLMRGRVGRLLARVENRLRERIERDAYRRYGTILTVTETDAAHLRGEPGMSGKTILPLPLAIDLDRYRPDVYTRVPERILLLGAFHSDFNADALEFMLDDVFPRVLRRRPDAVLEIVGPGADATIERCPSINVRYVGPVDDIRPYLGECAVMVLPLRFGGGVRLRMIEAAAMGVPVVSTPPGVAGMELERGVNYVEAREGEEMADAIVGLLDDPHAAERIGRNARRWAEERFATGTYPDRLDELLAAVTASRPAAENAGDDDDA